MRSVVIILIAFAIFGCNQSSNDENSNNDTITKSIVETEIKDPEVNQESTNKEEDPEEKTELTSEKILTDEDGSKHYYPAADTAVYRFDTIVSGKEISVRTYTLNDKYYPDAEEENADGSYSYYYIHHKESKITYKANGQEYEFTINAENKKFYSNNFPLNYNKFKEVKNDEIILFASFSKGEYYYNNVYKINDEGEIEIVKNESWEDGM